MRARETPRAYETLEPRELDALVAERVFGCKSGETNMDLICVCGLGVEGVSQAWPAVHWKGETKVTDEGTVYTHGEGYIPRFSTDPGAAIGVLEAMRVKGYRWEARAFPDEQVYVEVIPFKTKWPGIAYADADALPRAAVIASLRALEAENA